MNMGVYLLSIFNKIKNYHLISALVVTLIALLFGNWFVKQQLLAIAPEAIKTYPLSLALITLLEVGITILLFYCISVLCFAFIFRRHMTFSISLSFLPLLLVYSHFKLEHIFYLVIAIQLLLLIFYSVRTKIHKMNYVLDCFALIGLAALHTLLTTRYSPFNWAISIIANPGYVTEEIPVVAPIYKGFILAKQFAFSTFDYSNYAATLNPPITLNSPLLQFLTLIFDLPSISPVAYHAVLAAVYFILIIAGSFGMYLFLKYPMKVKSFYAFLGGGLLFFSKSAILGDMLDMDGGVFLPTYALFPYILLSTCMAFNKNSLLISTWIGVACAAQFFFMTPHPEGIIYSGVFSNLLLLGFCIFTKAVGLRRRLILCVVVNVSFLTLSAYTIIPIMIDTLNGNLHVFAHTGDIVATNIHEMAIYFKLLSVTIPASFILLWLYHRITPAYLSLLLLCCAIWAFFLATTHVGFIRFLLQILHIGLHVWIPWRIGLYLVTFSIVFAMLALSTFTELCHRFLGKILYISQRKVVYEHQ